MQTKTWIFLSLLILNAAVSLAQDNPELIQIKKEKGENAYYLNHEKLSNAQIRKYTQAYPQAYKQAKKAQANEIIGQILGVGGGFLLGYPIGTWLGGGEPNWQIAYVGMGLIGTSIPFYYGSQKRTENAVKIYNTELLNDPEKTKMEMSFQFYGTGLGFKLNF